MVLRCRTCRPATRRSPNPPAPARRHAREGAGGMIFLRNVQRAPARSVMTALGVAAGVALFVAITAITVDARQQISGAVSAYNMEVVVYERRANSPFTSRVSIPQMEQLQARYGEA